MLIFKLEKEINGRFYSLHLPMGVPWTEAIEISKELADMVVTLAAQAEEQANKAQEGAQEPAPLEA